MRIAAKILVICVLYSLLIISISLTNIFGLYSLTTLVGYFQLLGGLIIAVGNVGPIYKMWTKFSIEGVSFKNLFLVHFACCLFESYAFIFQNVVFLFFITNTICTILSFVMIVMYLYIYHTRPVETLV